MDVVKKPKESILAVLGKQALNSDVPVRFASYTRLFRFGDFGLLHNGVTGAIVLLCSDEVALLTHLESTKEGLPTSCVSGGLFQFLADQWFLIPVGHDENKMIRDMRSLLQITQKRGGMRSFKVLSTTGCNARCAYCYERGIKRANMSAETAKRVVEFIAEQSGGERVTLRWFGGEPLFNVDAIDSICEDLRARGIDFNSSMISNGYLFDAPMVARAAESWRLHDVQITIDGTRDVYNRVKAYVGAVDDPYTRVLDNIGLLLETGVQVVVRLNADMQNTDDLLHVIDELAERFGKYDGFRAYARALYQLSSEPDEMGRTKYDHVILLTDELDKRGIGGRGVVPALKFRCCMADNDRCCVINPEGGLAKCEHVVTNRLWGSIYSDEVNKQYRAEWKVRKPEIAACATCGLYPSCYRLQGCEGGFAECDEAYRAYLEYLCERAVRKAYERRKQSEGAGDSVALTQDENSDEEEGTYEQ